MARVNMGILGISIYFILSIKVSSWFKRLSDCEFSLAWDWWILWQEVRSMKLRLLSGCGDQGIRWWSRSPLLWYREEPLPHTRVCTHTHTHVHAHTHTHTHTSIPERYANRSHSHNSEVATDTSSCCSITKSCPTLQPHGLQHARVPRPSPSSRAYSNSCPLSQLMLCNPFILCLPLLLLLSIICNWNQSNTDLQLQENLIKLVFPGISL